MWILIDIRAPEPVRSYLKKMGTLIEIIPQSMVYDAISCHPDIYFFQHPYGLIAAPNISDCLKQKLVNVPFQFGENHLASVYPHTAFYNAVYTTYGIIHNTKISDFTILQLPFKKIHCNQAYTRCNVIQAGKIIFTSDRGIEKTLKKLHVPVYYIEPSQIVLPGMKHGFFGGCCGVFQNKLYVCGQLNYLYQGLKIRQMVEAEGLDIVELYDGPLLDVGGIMFLN